jgi:hypothetical protein
MFLKQISDQIVAPLSSKHSASIVWNDEDDDSDDTGSVNNDTDRIICGPLVKTNDQEEGAMSRHISRHDIPANCSMEVDPSTLIPCLLYGETTQAFWTVTFTHRVLWEEFDHSFISRMLLEQLL